jgi:hypothetical protein
MKSGEKGIQLSEVEFQMKKTTLATVVGFTLGYATFVAGQNSQVTNFAGAPFPMMQWTPTRITGQEQTSDMTSKNFYAGNVEIRTPGMIVRADGAVQDLKTGHVELRGSVTATLVPVQPIWPDSSR